MRLWFPGLETNPGFLRVVHSSLKAFANSFGVDSGWGYGSQGWKPTLGGNLRTPSALEFCAKLINERAARSGKKVVAQLFVCDICRD